MKISILGSAVVIALSTSMVNAQEPLVLTGAQMDNVTAADSRATRNGFNQRYSVDFYKNVDENVFVTIDKFISSQAYIYGNVGTANADAKAFGYDTVAETLTLTYAIQGQGSGAFSESTSATNGHYYLINGN